MSTPYQTAKSLCDDNPQIMPFAEQLEHYGNHGFIWSSPTCFVLASYHWQTEEWYVGLSAGNWWELFDHAPHPAKWACFVRRGVEHRWHYSRIQQLAKLYDNDRKTRLALA